MFRCTDCNAEYKTKPDYCDCGNNTFEEIPSALDLADTSRFPAGQILSIIIFIFCIILAIIPWTIPANKQTSEHKNIKLENPQKNIPDIEKIWNNTPAKQETPADIKETHVLSEPQAVKVIQNNPPAAKEKTQTKPNPKPVSKQVQPTKKVQKTQQQEPPKQASAKTMQPTKPTQTAAAPKPVMDKTEYENYKNGIRLTLLSKLDLVKISGEGDCAVKFSVAENGKLINRGFLYQSNNKSVNDQVYLMLMRLPSYKTPPKGYNGEVIKLKFYINNGYYEISFIT